MGKGLLDRLLYGHKCEVTALAVLRSELVASTSGGSRRPAKAARDAEFESFAHLWRDRKAPVPRHTVVIRDGTLQRVVAVGSRIRCLSSIHEDRCELTVGVAVRDPFLIISCPLLNTAVEVIVFEVEGGNTVLVSVVVVENRRTDGTTADVKLLGDVQSIELCGVQSRQLLRGALATSYNEEEAQEPQDDSERLHLAPSGSI